MLPDPDTLISTAAEDVDSFDGVLVDVRIPEAFGEAHIRGAVNFPVYQVDFLKNFPAAYPDKSTRILVYGDGGPYKADMAAVGRLEYLGYSNVSVLEGGLDGWKADGRSIEGSGIAEVDFASGRFGLDVERTKVRWVGRNLMNQHDGEVAASGGFVEVDESGVPVAGKVTVNMKEMTCHDLEDKSLAAGLISHLSNADFFDVENHPEASIELTDAEAIEGASYGLSNFKVSGLLSARGRSVKITFDALVQPIEGGYVFQANFDFDRTQLGALYGSGRIFERLGMHIVNDMVSMDITAFFTVSE
ncbi:MAG: YceI family protein [Verrucomicrobiota bacterium]